jgi:hypothetical protein
VVDRLTPDMLAEYDQPIGIGPLISVDTSGPVNVAELAGAVRALLSAAGGTGPERVRLTWWQGDFDGLGVSPARSNSCSLE